MAFPNSIRVKLISDEAGMVSLTPVVVQEMDAIEFMGRILAHTGKDPKRVAKLLRGGSFVHGASRFRWEGFEPSRADLNEILSTFPDAEPDRPFEPERCSLVVIHFARGGTVELEPEPLARRRFLKRRSFWDALEELAAKSTVRYLEYSYGELADRYRLDLTPSAAAALQEASTLLSFSNLTRRFRSSPPAGVDFYTRRS